MKIYKNPAQEDWEALSQRPSFKSEDLGEKVQGIINEVKKKGNQALRDFSLQFDGVNLEDLKVNPSEIEIAKNDFPILSFYLFNSFLIS